MIGHDIIIFEKLDDLKIKHKGIQEQLKKGLFDKMGLEMPRYNMYIVIDGDKLCVLLFSTSYLTRAADLLRYLSEKVDCFSSLEILEEKNSEDSIASYCIAEDNNNGIPLINDVCLEQIEKGIKSYDKSTIVIDAKTFFENNKKEIQKWNQYKKVSFPRSYVSMSVLKEKLKLKDTDSILLKTLENESGVILKGCDDAIIMIGMNGEPYDIPAERFNELYEDVNLKEQEMNLEGIRSAYKIKPTAIIMNSGEVIELMDYAILCQSKKKNEVYACLMNKNVKVFSTRITGTNQYYYGNGEQEPFYLTVDKEVHTAVHIVNRYAFEKSYEFV